MAMIGSDYTTLMKHALAGNPDSRLDLLVVLNQALYFLFDLHDWKFKGRPPLDVTFLAAGTPTAPVISAITRTSNVVTLTLAVAPTLALAVGQSLIVSGVTDTSFNGAFTVSTVISTTQCTYAQTGADGASSAGNAGQFAYEQFINLPSDFGELISVCTKNNAISNIFPTSLEEIAWRRGYVYATAFDRLYRCAMSYPGQTSTTVMQGVPRLEIWPRPTASNPNGDLTLVYKGGPIAVTNTTVPNMPQRFERLLTLLARLFAQGYEEEVIQEDPLVQAEVANLLEADGRQETNHGQIRNGAAKLKGNYQNRPFSVISDPANRL